jgi:hypothetical protein
MAADGLRRPHGRTDRRRGARAGIIRYARVCYAGLPTGSGQQLFGSNIQIDFFHLDPGQDRSNPVGLKQSIAHIGPGKTEVK